MKSGSFPTHLVHQSRITLRDYDGEVRQVILRGNSQEDRPS